MVPASPPNREGGDCTGQTGVHTGLRGQRGRVNFRGV